MTLESELAARLVCLFGPKHSQKFFDKLATRLIKKGEVLATARLPDDTVAVRWMGKDVKLFSDDEDDEQF